MGVATVLSRVLGLAREILYASFMGAGPIAGAFKLAFMIPNLFRRLLGEGALTAAFIPIFKEKEKKEGEAEMWTAANAVISGLLVAASVIVVLAIAGVSLVLYWNPVSPMPGMGQPAISASGVEATFWQAGWLKWDTRLMLDLTRIMFPYMLLVCLAAIFMGMLNARGHFFVPAMGSVVLNLVLIVVVFFVAPFFGETLHTQIYALAYGVLIAGAAQAAYQLPKLYSEGYRFRWVSPWRNETVRIVVRRMVPGMMGVAAFQINILTTQSIAAYINMDIVAIFDYAVRLMEFPQGVFGLSLATFLLPTLSGLATEKKYPEFRATLGQGLGYMAFANVIATILLLVLAEPIVRLLFERNEFGPVATQRVSFALRCLAPGLIAFSTVNILARGFYALGDTSTPMKISCVCLAMNIVFVFWLVRPFAEGGMGVANVLSSLFNVYFLFYALRRKLSRLDLREILPQIVRMVVVGIGAGVLAWLISHFWETNLGHGGLLQKLGAVLVPMAAAALAYWVVLWWMRLPQAHEYWELFSDKLQRFRR